MMHPDLKLTPIYDTDLKKSPAELISKIRLDLVKLRGQLSDLERAYPAWYERFNFARGGLTCVVSALHESQLELENYQTRWGWQYELPKE